MGLQTGRLKNHMMTASSQWDINHAAYFARLHGRRRGRYMGAWSSRYNNRYQWLQVDFGGAAKIIRLSTQGRQDANQWVTQYYVSHSLDRVHFSEYKERNSRKVICNFILSWSISLFSLPYELHLLQSVKRTLQLNLRKNGPLFLGFLRHKYIFGCSNSNPWQSPFKQTFPIVWEYQYIAPLKSYLSKGFDQCSRRLPDLFVSSFYILVFHW